MAGRQVRLAVDLDLDPPRDVVVEVRSPDARLVDVLHAVGAGPGVVDVPAWWVDGTRLDVDTPLTQMLLADGARLAPHPSHPALRHAVPGRDCRPPVGAIATIVAGPGSGTVHDLADGRAVEVGRDDDVGIRLGSATVSSRHLRLVVTGDTVDVEDHASQNGTWIDGRALAPHVPRTVSLPVTLQLGACALRLEPAPACDRPVGRPERVEDGRWAFNRPPRPAQPPAVAPVDVPQPPTPTTQVQALRWAAILAPLALGGVMVFGMNRDPRFALFMLLSPVVAVATWWSNRRRARKEQRSAGATWEGALAAFDADLERARTDRAAREEAVHPHLGEVVRRATEPSTRLWERRPGEVDAFVVRLGLADREVDLDLRRRRSSDDESPAGVEEQARRTEIARHAAAHRHLPGAPLPLDLVDTPVVGLVGDRAMALGVARSLLVQLATLHGPADLPVAVLVAPEHTADWGWARWLPHTAVDERRLVAAEAATATSIAHTLQSRHAPVNPGRRRTSGPFTGLVIDDVTLISGPSAPVRDLLRPADGTTIALVVAEHVDLLPAACAMVVTCHADGSGEALEPAVGTRQAVLLSPLAVATARRTALALAHLVDPERTRTDATLPPLVRLVDLLETDRTGPHGQGQQVPKSHDPTRRHRESTVDPTDGGRRLATPLGRDAGGTAWLDLVTDGPHALIGGTTGSGKSELLRSLVAGLAARHTTDQVVFVLVDYKGGAAFRECADLPHTVGLVTDLDDHLGERALTSMEAELRRREEVLAAAACSDLPAYVGAGSPDGPLPRLVVVIDEFATLAAELPGFLDALVGIAQRGRSLGVHLVLATQRPRGSVDANVRANTNLRIALRVQDASDSLDLLDDGVAAELPRHLPGRAWIRRGHGELTLVQTALASAPRPGPDAPVVAAPFRFAPTSPLPEPTPDDQAGTDLSELVAALRQRHRADGREPPRRPWLPMLDPDLSLLDLPTRGPADTSGRDGPGLQGDLPFGVVDLPAEQAQRVARWDCGATTLAIIGPSGSGTTTALSTVAIAAARRWSPDDLHLYVVDAGGGGLSHLQGLTHAGAVLGVDAPDEHAQLLSWLAGDVRRRQALGEEDRRDLPRLLVLLDNLTGFLTVHDDRASRAVAEDLATVLGEGPSMGVASAVATERLAGVTSSLRGALGRLLVLGRPAERELALVGLREGDLPEPVPGRAVDAASGHVVQIARVPDDVAVTDVVRGSGRSGPNRPPRPILGLPDHVDVAALPAPSGPRPLGLPVGVGRIGAATSIVLHPGDHLIVSGPARSGRTSVLKLLSSQLRRAVPDAIQVAVCQEGRSALHGWPSLDAAGTATELATVLRAGLTQAVPWVVLVDDVRWATEDDVFHQLVEARPDLHLIVAGRPDEVRGGFGTWPRKVRASKSGILLQPDLATDGELVGATLPRHLRVPLKPGRGFVVNAGTPELTQFAAVPTGPALGSLAS